MTRVLIVDDHPLFCEALGTAVSRAFDATLLYASTLRDTRRLIERSDDLDLVLLDLKIPGCGTFSGLQTLRQRYPHLPVLVVSALATRKTVEEAIRHGAAGFLSKTSTTEEIIAAIRHVLSGGQYVPANYRSWNNADEGARTEMAPDGELLSPDSVLTERQRRVLRLLSQGKLNKQIAHELDIAEPTVKAHVSAILRKLNVHSRTQAVIVASRLEQSGAL